MSDLKSKTIITAALTGAVTPAGYNIPETPEKIAEDAYACWKAGAAIVHLHMRDEQGLGTMDAARFKKTIELIRAHEDCDVVINCTSSGDNRVSGGDPAGNAIRMLHMRTVDGIEMGSYDAGSFNWMPSGVFMNTPQFLQELGDVYMERGIKPEFEIFDTGMLDIVNYYVKKGTPACRKLPLPVLPGRVGRNARHSGKPPLPEKPHPGGLHLVRFRRGRRTPSHPVCDAGAERQCPRGHGGQCGLWQG